VSLALVVGTVPANAQVPTHPGPGGTPQFDHSIERRNYVRAGADEMLAMMQIVYDESKHITPGISPQEMKSSELRSRLLDLRLLMDFNAYLYDAEKLDPMRDLVDAAYENVGLFKDLYDQSQLTGQPINPDEQAKRGAAMNASIDWLHNADKRNALLAVFKQPHQQILHLNHDQTPRLWNIAKATPDSGKSTVAIVALLCGNVLTNLVKDGLLVDDVLDEKTEAKFHDVRKALRSVLILGDMFPATAAAVGDRRDALAKLVSAYGRVNDASIAYHNALKHGGDADERKKDLLKEYKHAQELVNSTLDSGALTEYVQHLAPLWLIDADPFH
jgi:hypothetical protein